MGDNAARIVGSAIIGMDVGTAIVNGRIYVIHPPTIHKMAGAGYYLSGIGDERTVRDVLLSLGDTEKAAHALSWLIQGDDGLAGELSGGTLDEVVDGIETAYSLISVANFSRLSALARNVGGLMARRRR